MKTVLMIVAALALLPLALPAAFAVVLIGSVVAYWLVPLLWVVGAIYIGARLIAWSQRELWPKGGE